MHIKLLKSRNSASISEYSGKKIREGNADLVAQSIPKALQTIRKLESSPKLDVHVRNLGLHFELSPGDEEQDDISRILNLTETFMYNMGLKDQPWLLVRHRDIKRTHYHIETTRARANGKTISSAWIRYRAYVAAEDAIRQLGYSFGRRNIGALLDYEVFDKSAGNICRQFEAIFNHVIGRDIQSIDEFANGMRMRNVDVRISTKSRTEKLIFAGLSDFGERDTSPVYNLDREGKMLAKLQEVIKGNIERNSRETVHYEAYENTESCPSYDNRQEVDEEILANRIRELLIKSHSLDNFEENCMDAGIIVTTTEDYVNGLSVEVSALVYGEIVDFGELQHLFTNGENDLMAHENAWGRKEQLLDQEGYHNKLDSHMYSQTYRH